MIFTDIAIANFFSIAEEITIDLVNQGLVLISGENHDSSAADSNGSGKSTIFEALLWCLWGKTVRGQTSDSVINSTTKRDCYVYLNMVDGDKQYSVRRFRNHQQFKNGLQLWSGDTDLSEGTSTLTQVKIDELLGIDFESFIRGPMLPQGSFKRFSQMTDSEQKIILENAVQLNILPAALEKVKERISIETLNFEKLDLSLQRTQEELAREQEDLLRLQEEKVNFNTQVLRQKAAALVQHLWAFQDIDKAWDALTPNVDMTESHATLDRVQELEKKLKAHWEDRVSAANAECNKADSAYQLCSGKLKDVNKIIQKMRDLQPGTACPTCFQVISKNEVDKCIKVAEQEWVGATEAVRDSQEAYNRAEVELRSVKEERDTSLSRASQMHREALDASAVLARQQWQHDNLIQTIEKAENALASRGHAVKAQIPMDTLIQGKSDHVEELKNRLNVYTEELSTQQTLLDHLNFWKVGFSNAGLKSKILAAITPFMNKHADQYIRDLTDGELEIEFSTQTTLKTGQTREQFRVEVRNKNGASSYEGSSGGEKARADLAINFTLSDLVASRSKKSYPQRWFDEPFESLDEAGIEAVMELLAKMVSTCGSIFVITHQGAMKALFTKVITVSKKNGATSLVAS